MVQYKEYFTFISNKLKNRQAANCWPCSNVVHTRLSFGFPLVFLWLSYRTLKWIRGAFEEGSKVMQRYTLLTDISPLPHKAYLLAPRTYVQESKNISSCNEVL